MKRRPCPDCWVEAQRREATTGEPADDTYRQLLSSCPDGHDKTPMPPAAGDPFQTQGRPPC